MAFIKFRTFAGGELDPALHSRTDLVKYQTGAKTLRNILVRKSGGIANRAGTVFKTETLTNKKTRLIEFAVQGQDSLMLEFTDLRIRVLKDGVVVNTITTPYTEAQLSALDYAQNIDTMTIAHRSHHPKELVLTAYPAGFSFGNVSFENDNVDSILMSSLAGHNVINPQTTKYNYACTKLDLVTGEESRPVYCFITNGNANLSASVYVSLKAQYSAGDIYKVYKELNGIYGLVGIIRHTSDALTATEFFRDIGVVPDTTQYVAEYRDMFDDGNYPSAVAHAQQRVIYANTSAKPETLEVSILGRPNKFYEGSFYQGLNDASSFDFNLAGNKLNPVNHILDLNGLVILTENSEWGAEKGSALTPNSIQLRQHSYNGSSKSMKPLVLNDTALYVHKSERSIRELGYSYQVDGYTGDDITSFASHLFKGKKIVSWDYQRSPDSIVWVVFDDGTIASMTYIKEQQIMAWTRHDFDGGQAEQVCVVTEGLDEEVYFTVKRLVGGTTKRYIEKLSQRDFTDFSNQIFTDSTYLYNGYSAASGAGKLTISGTTYLDDDTLNLDVENSFFASTHIGEEIHFQSSEGLIRLEILSIDIDPKKATAFILNKPELPIDVRSVQISSWALAKKNFSGVSHLPDGKVSIVADGYVLASPNNPNYDEILCTSGVVALPTAHIMVQIGLPITSDFETLAIDSSEVNLSVENKLVRSVNIDFRNSKGGFVGTELPAGNGIENLIEVKPRSNENYESATALKSEMIAINTLTAWDRNGSAVFRQLDPLPFEITSVIPQITVGAKR